MESVPAHCPISLLSHPRKLGNNDHDGVGGNDSDWIPRFSYLALVEILLARHYVNNERPSRNELAVRGGFRDVLCTWTNLIVCEGLRILINEKTKRLGM